MDDMEGKSWGEQYEPGMTSFPDFISFSIAAVKYPDESKLRKKKIILVHSLRF